MIGTTVSHYRVVGSLGAGGMGVVYKAEDLKLARHVALKFLPPDRTNDRQVVERFMREARTASALNHSGICTIYEIDEHEGAQFIAMELLEGDPLDRRIGGRPLAISALLDWAIQLADALDAAHAQGVLHRDIKPANIYITTRGQAKILDFGLAKLVDAEPRGGSSEVSLTQLETQLLTTKQGTALGTVAYMSPEQARGEELDVRTDLFSFGLVLYEMATGQRTFDGSTSALVFDAILNREPRAPIELNANVPLALERVIARCLQKDRNLRYQTAAAIREDLQQVRRDRESGTVSTRSAAVVVPAASSGTSWPSGVLPSAVLPSAAVPATVTQPTKTGPLGRYGAMVMAALGVVSLGAAVLITERSDPPQTTAAAVAAPAAVTTVEISPLSAEGVAGAAPTIATPAVNPAPSVSVLPASAPTTGAAPAAATPAAGARGTDPSGVPSAVARGTGAAPTTGTGARAGLPRRGGAAEPAAVVVAPVPAAAPAVDPGAELLRIARAKFDQRLYDQAYADLESLVSQHAARDSAADAYLLMGTIRERQNRPEDAMAAYVELRTKHTSSAAAAEGTFLNAELLLRSKRNDRDRAALELFTAVESHHPESPFAPRALSRRATIEDRLRMRVNDPQLSTSVPLSLVTYRTLVERYPSAPAAEAAFDALSRLYADIRQYERAAASLQELATRFPSNRVDAAWRAGELFEDRVKDADRAKASYALVPAQSPRYRDAQRKLQ